MYKKILSILGIILISFSTNVPAQQNPMLDKASNDKVPVIITSQQAEFNNKENKATYTGNVKVVRENATMYSDQLDAFFDQTGKELDHIVATGNVKVVQENRIITSQKGVFYNAEQKIVLTGSPISREGENVVEGTRMTYFFNQERVIVEDAKSTLNPDKNKDKEKSKDEKNKTKDKDKVAEKKEKNEKDREKTKLNPEKN